MIPDFATHYHLRDREPFLSLSDLEEDAEDPVFLDLLNKHRTAAGYRRRYGKKYLAWRKEAEDKLRRMFILRGGLPNRRYPVYFVLGESKWFCGLNRDHEKLVVPLSEFPSKATSVTFPDSYIAMCRPDRPYYEKVYFLSELPKVVERYEPSSYDKYWAGDFEKYIEVQVWDDAFAETHRQKWRRQRNDR